MTISQQDIHQLIKEPSAYTRSDITQKVAVDYNHAGYSPREREIAEEIFRLLLRDTEIMVRQTLAESLKHSMDVPHDIVMALANDVIEVASPILGHSYVLQEEDLLHIIEATREIPRLTAIARRDTMTESVVDALVQHGETSVLSAVMHNDNVQLPRKSLEFLLEEYYADHSVMKELVYRGGLPYDIAEKLFTLVSDELKTKLTKRYRLPMRLVGAKVDDAKQTATLQFLSQWMSQRDIEKLVKDMYANKRLTDAVIIRSLCIGDLRFFEAAMAKRAGVSVMNARILIFEPGGLGFDAFYDASTMPESYKQAVNILLKFALEETHYGRYKIDNFGERMIARIVRHGYHKNINNMDYLIRIIGKDTRGAATLH